MTLKRYQIFVGGKKREHLKVKNPPLIQQVLANLSIRLSNDKKIVDNNSIRKEGQVGQ